MKLNQIHAVLDTALAAKRSGQKFVPLFSGPAGIGKSEVIQAWAKSKGLDFGFIDLRPAYVEAPDFIGLVSINNGRTTYNLPEFWPTEGEGLILLEEVNRANPSVMNALMQLLTDFKVLNYTVPKGWIIAAVVNPENENCDVNSMDSAFRNRFVEFEVEFDKQSFIEFIKSENWHEPLITFIRDHWTYKKPSELGTEGHYISPRSLARLNTAHKFSVCESITNEVIHSVLGRNYAQMYLEHIKKTDIIKPIDFVNRKEWAIEKLKSMLSDDKNFRGDVISGLSDGVIDLILKKDIPLQFIKEYTELLPTDLGAVFLIDLVQRGLESSILIDLENYIRENWDYFQTIEKKKKMIISGEAQ